MKETSINDLDTRLSDEESNIVDSIINDLNNDKTPGMPPNLPSNLAPGNAMPHGMPQHGMPQQGMPQQGMPPRMPPGMPQQGMPQQGMPQQGMPQQKIMVTPEQKKILDTLPIEEQQIYLRKIKMKQHEDKIILDKSLEDESDDEDIEDEINKNILTEEKIKEIKGGVITDLKNSVKEPILISLVAFILSLPQINKLFLLSKTTILITDNGDLTIFSLIIKALLVGIIYFTVKKYNII